MKEIKIYEIPNIDFIERIDDPYIGMIFYVADIDTYYSVKTLKEINGINMKGSKVVEYVIDEYADFGTGSGGGSGLTATQLSNIAKIPAIKATVDALPNNYASKNHNHSEYASSSHRHNASEIDNLPSGGGTGLTTEQAQQLATAYEHSQQQHVSFDDLNNIDAVSVNGYSFSRLMTLEEYNNLAIKDSNTIYLVIDDGTETPTKTLSSISAVYNQGSTAVYPSTNLDSLKNNLTVTATYSDNSNSVISSGYSLSGNLTVGTSTITVTYSGKTTTFNVTVTEESTPGMDSAYSYLKVTVPASATTEQSTLYLSKPTRGTMSSLYINDVPKDVPTGTNQTTTGYSLNEGENIIKIKGNFTCWNSKCNIDALQLQNDLTTCSGMFYGCPNITFNATIPSTVTNTNAMFRGSGLVNGVDIPSSVTNTASMYQSVGTLKTPSIVPDTVTLCDSMYGGCVSLQGTVNVPNSATDISSFLNSAGTNGEGISVTGINTSSVTNYNLAFYGAKITTIEQSFADLIKQAKPATVTKSICFKASDTNLSSPITIAEVHSDWKQ